MSSWLLRFDIRLVQTIAQQLQDSLLDLVTLSAVSKGLHVAAGPMLYMLYNKVWRSSNIDLFNWFVWAGVPESWTNCRDAVELEFYEAERDNAAMKLHECSVFRPGQHWEDFNQLHGFYVLTDKPMRHRYLGGMSYPYIGMSQTAVANSLSELCMHPPEDSTLAIVCAFVCPSCGLYLISGVGVRLFDPRARGPIMLELFVAREGKSVQTIENLVAVGRYGCAQASGIKRLVLSAGDRIGFAVSLSEHGPPFENGFGFGATRVSWQIRHGMCHG